MSDGDIFLKVEPRHEARVLVAQARQVTHPHLERSENVCLSQELKKKNGNYREIPQCQQLVCFYFEFLDVNRLEEPVWLPLLGRFCFQAASCFNLSGLSLISQ